MYGILFDLDGTLADSDSIHFQAWQKILADINTHQQEIDREFYDKNISGRFNDDITRALLPDVSDDKRKDVGEKKDLLFYQLAQENLQPTKGLETIIAYIQENRSKLKIGLATNATRKVTEFELNLLKIDIKTFFDAVVIAEEFGIGKPNPEMYLELTQRLNINKNACVVFEDSIAGVRAAVTAQIKCIGILTSAKKETLEEYGTWRTVKNFEEIDLEEVWKTFQSN
ncbi:hypothetical protein I4U23_003141 [Adineta vaga]|nr:hypothetical protein I4U23_003141 [Adineta vaga]